MPHVIANLLESIPDWQTKAASQLVALLNAPTIELVDPQLYTWAGVGLIAGADGAEGLRLGLEGNGLGWVVHQLGGSGMQLSNPLVQQVLIGLAQAGVPGCAALAETGIHYVSRVQQAGLPPATLGQVVEAVSFLTFLETKAQMMRDAGLRYNIYVNALDGWDGSGYAPIL